MEAVQHPLGGPALETVVVAERDRVGRLAPVRELIVVAGPAEAVAGGLSEATEARLGARAAADLYDAEAAKELGEAWIP